MEKHTLKPTNLGITEKSSDELDAIALAGGVVGVIDPTKHTRAYVNSNTLAGGWGARWISTHGNFNSGVLILVPQTSRTRDVFRQGQIAHYCREGLQEEEAQTIMGLDTPFKQELTTPLVSVLGDARLTEIFLQHPKAYGFTSGRQEWLHKYEEELPQYIRKLSAPREVSLALMVNALRGGKGYEGGI